MASEAILPHLRAPMTITGWTMSECRAESKLSWTTCSRRTMAKKKMSPEVRAKLEDVRRDVRELIALFQAKLNERRT